MVELELDEQHPTSFTHSMRSNLQKKKKNRKKAVLARNKTVNIAVI